jgi:hypothetical protein
MLQLRQKSGEPDARVMNVIAKAMRENGVEIVSSVYDSKEGLRTLIEDAYCGSLAVESIGCVWREDKVEMKQKMGLIRIVEEVIVGKTATAVAAQSHKRRKKKMVEMEEDEDFISVLPADAVVDRLFLLAPAMVSSCQRGCGKKADFAMGDAFLSLAKAGGLFGAQLEGTEVVLKCLLSWYEEIGGTELICAGIKGILRSKLYLQPKVWDGCILYLKRENGNLDKRVKSNLQDLVRHLNSPIYSRKEPILASVCLLMGRLSFGKRKKLVGSVCRFLDAVLGQLETYGDYVVPLVVHTMPKEIRRLVWKFLLDELLLVEDISWSRPDSVLHVPEVLEILKTFLGNETPESSPRRLRVVRMITGLFGKELGEEKVFEYLEQETEPDAKRLWLQHCFDWTSHLKEDEEEFWKRISSFDADELPPDVLLLLVKTILAHPMDATLVRILSIMNKLVSAQADVVLHLLEAVMDQQEGLSQALLEDSESSEKVKALLFERLAPLLVMRVMSIEALSKCASEKMVQMLLERMVFLYEFPQVRRLASETMAKVDPNKAIAATTPVFLDGLSKPQDEAALVGLKSVLFTWCSLMFVHGNNVFGDQLEEQVVSPVLRLGPNLKEAVVELLSVVVRFNSRVVLKFIDQDPRVCEAVARFYQREKQNQEAALLKAVSLEMAPLLASSPAYLTGLASLVLCCPDVASLHGTEIVKLAFAILDQPKNQASSTEDQIRALTVLSSMLTIDGSKFSPDELKKALHLLEKLQNSPSPQLQKLAKTILAWFESALSQQKM